MAGWALERHGRSPVTPQSYHLSHRFLHTDISEQAKTDFLELFPAKSRLRLANGASAVLQCMAGRPKSTQQLRTVRSRWLYYFLFCHAVGLAENPCLENVPQQRRNAQMALYAVHLASGDILYCRAIKAATIGAYLRDVATFLARFFTVNVRKFDATQLRLAPAIQSVLDEVIRWEKVPDKREPFTPTMWVHLHKANTGINDDYTLEPSICNWFGGGRFRRISAHRMGTRDGCKLPVFDPPRRSRRPEGLLPTRPQILSLQQQESHVT
jgi:hypothetical protein